MKKTLKLSLILLLFTSGGSLWAQYGIGTVTPNESAALQVVSPDKGVLIPNVSLTASSTFAPITGTADASHNGMLVWNTNTLNTLASGLTGVGFYFWDGGAAGGWYKISTSGDDLSGTVTNSTLRWDGTDWVENTSVLHSETGTATFSSDVTISGDLSVTGTSTLATTTISDDLTVQGTSTLATTTITGDITLEKGLVDSAGNLGTAGQILSTTGTQTRWVDPNGSELQTLTATGNVADTTTLLLAVPASTMVATLADAATLSQGFKLLIRRNSGYEGATAFAGSGDLLSITGNGAQTINGQASINLNVGYQSITLIRISATEWISVD